MEQKTEQNNELIKMVDSFGLEEKTIFHLIKIKFLPFIQQLDEWGEKGLKLVVENENQIELMKDARSARLILKEIRVNADKARKELKEDSNKYNKAVQDIYNLIYGKIKPIEDHLQKQEDFIAIQEKNRIEKLRETRLAELVQYNEFIPIGLDFGAMSDDDFSKLLNGAKLQLQAKIEKDKKDLEEKNAREKSDAEQREKEKAENEKLKIEAAENEKKAAIEREKYEKEKAEREKLEKELDAKNDAEIKASKELDAKRVAEQNAIIEAEKKMKSAPDKEKLIELAKQIGDMKLPNVDGNNANVIINNVRDLLNKVSKYITDSTIKL